MVYVAPLLWRRGEGCFTLDAPVARQVSHGIASLLAALANPPILWSFLYQASSRNPGLLLETNSRDF